MASTNAGLDGIRNPRQVSPPVDAMSMNSMFIPQPARHSQTSLVYSVFLHGGSIVFLVYVQIFHVYLPNQEAEKEANEHPPVQTPRATSPQTVRQGFLNPVMEDSISLPGSDLMTPVSGSSLPRSAPSGPSSTLIMGDAMKAVRRRRRSRIAMASIPETNEVDMEDDLHLFLSTKHGTASFSHEATSFFMRLGALLFAIGHIVYLALQIEYTIGLQHYHHCPGVRSELHYPYYTWMAFLLVQTFFLFKNKDLSVTDHKPLVKFGLMHVAATNVCVWVRVLVFEVMEAIHESNHHKPHPVVNASQNSTDCDEFQPLLDDLSPFLFPFVLEYSLVGAAAMMSMYESIDFFLTKGIMEVLTTAVRRSHHIHQMKLQHFHAGKHEDEEGLSKSHTGMYFGFMVLAGTIVSMSLSMYWASKDKEWDSDLTFLLTDIIIISLLLLASISAIASFRKLGYASSRDNKIDAILIFISFAGLFLLELYTFVASVQSINANGIAASTVLDSVCAVLSIAQGGLQVVFIIDSMHRYVVFQKQNKEKPGREMVTFLIVVNVSTWLFKTIQEKHLSVSDESGFFGDVAWAIILNLSLPLLLFFRFHSSICLAHIWHTAYVREEDPFSPEDLAVDIVKDLQTRM
ncbi:hypothetical protein CAPTEDRAFT_200837 [Capitella teleta]|uniref:Otopetrin n=1 Tax=Capitella teleta TaxID=283909 RepID=R7V2F5_CAPTE|nr:hypothetical protein CAPTEDRAFT_200837 [Capitella teleta]|eukprot:ELU10521.1 hypothetical protein CAPTEDRAFT_200837 [Capitella teleta]